jgi:serpin B
MYKTLSESGEYGGKNIFFSPYSISSAMAMLYAGASGDAEKELAQVMNYGPDTHRSMTRLRRVMEMSSRLDILRAWNTDAASIDMDSDLYRSPVSMDLLVANAVWPSQKIKLTDFYKSSILEYYGGGITPLDYYEKWRESEKIINDWTDENTRGRIKYIIPEGLLKPSGQVEVAFVITNAIYFKAGWKTEFNESDTVDSPFYTPDGPKTVRMMYDSRKALYLETSDFQMLALPYGSSEPHSYPTYSMIVMLPKVTDKAGGGDGLSLMKPVMNAENFANLLTQMISVQVDVYLPKFEVENEKPINLVDQFKNLGLTSIFQPRLDNFLIMTESNKTSHMFVNHILHKAFISVDEHGTEAAAATAVVAWMVSGAFSFDDKKTVEFRADHPFLYFIVDEATRTILFMGRYMKPE